MRLSKQYGLNPTITKCFFCGKNKSVALLGHIGGRGKDIQAPKECILDYDPCNECRAVMRNGVSLIEAQEIPTINGLPPLKAIDGREMYPMGRLVVVEAKKWSEMVQKEFHNGDICFVEPKGIDDLLNVHEKQEGYE